MAKTEETTRQESASGTQSSEAGAQEGRGLHLHTRTLHPPVPIPYITRGDGESSRPGMTSWMPGRPGVKDVMFYGGLGAMTVAGALEWPIALAVGGATWLVRSMRRETPSRGAEASADTRETRDTRDTEHERRAG